MRNISQIRILLVLFFALITTGCAHKNLVEEGGDLNRQGRYELAVEKYTKALALKPKDRKTQQDLAFAQGELNFWLDGVLAQADAAKQQGLDGRALLLYSKVAQLRHDQHSLNQYKQLHRQLSDQSKYKIAINYPTTLGSNLGRSLSDVQVIMQAQNDMPNQFSVKLSYSKPQFTTGESQREKVKQYVSGTETVANPDYLHLQDDIANERDHINDFIGQYDHQRDDVDDQHRRVSNLRKDREIAQLKLGNATAGSNEYNKWRNEVNRLNTAVSKADQTLSNYQSQLDKLDHKIASAKKSLNEYLNALSYLPPTVEQDVYSDYLYLVKEVTRTGSGKLIVAFKDGSKKSKTVSVSYTDKGHDEHEIIGLGFNPIKLLSDKKLARKYNDKSRKEAEQAIARNATDYRNNLRDSANQMAGIDEKLEAWVRYGLSGQNGVDGYTAKQIRSQLQQEFGIAGEFEANKLLQLFSR
jgi:flagellar biosynthesis chaperone FliJ